MLFNFIGSKSMDVIIVNNKFLKKMQLLTILFLGTTIMMMLRFNDKVGSRCVMDALCVHREDVVVDLLKT